MCDEYLDGITQKAKGDTPLSDANITICPSEFRAVAELVWKLNPYVRAYTAGADEVYIYMIEHAKRMDLSHWISSTGGWNLQPLRNAHRIVTHIHASVAVDYNPEERQKLWEINS